MTKTLNYDQKISGIIKSLRKMNGVTVAQLAKNINMPVADYRRIEKGECAFTSSQLKLAAAALNTNHFQILALADYDDDRETFQPSTFSEILIRFILITEKKSPKITFTTDELEFVISKIRARYAKANSSP